MRQTPHGDVRERRSAYVHTGVTEVVAGFASSWDPRSTVLIPPLITTFHMYS
jgi:hypothetical protein